MYKIDIMALPNVQFTANGNPRAKQPLTVANVAKILKLAKLSLKFNVMAHRFEITGAGFSAGDLDQARALAAIEDTLTMLDIGGVARLPDMLLTLARETGSYHPMEDWLLSEDWDGTDRLEGLAASVPTDSVVWPEYLRKWLIQGVEAIRGWRAGVPRSIPHVLVFVGGQGAGKGRWLRTLAPGFVLADAELHLNGFSAKDQQLQVLRYPLVELGEIDSTFKKSEVSALKSFLSRQVDSLRAPYARLAIDRQRMTVFAGSVNSTEFLNDPTGARRFWPVKLRDGETLDWSHGVDVRQVWAQANHYWKVDAEDWNLEDETVAAREGEIHNFVQQSAAVELVAGHYYKYANDHAHYAIMSKTEICLAVRAGTHPAAMGEVGHWLEKHLGPARKLKGVYRSWAFPLGDGMTGELLHEVAARCTPAEAKRYVLERGPEK